jgi:hypothetical protein
MKLHGHPITLNAYKASETRTNRYFQTAELPDFERFYLPDAMTPFTDLTPLGRKEFREDDNRSVVTRDPVLKVEGVDFFQNVKGIGSTTGPFSRRPLKRTDVTSFLRNSVIKSKIMEAKEEPRARYFTGEMWSRGSPYGIQGLDYASIAMKAAEMADSPTSIRGFRICPVVKIVHLPQDLQEEVRRIYWYTQFKGPMVQEERLVPSNVRVYFHSDKTLGGDTSWVFDLFEIDSDEKAIQLEKNFLKSGMAILTLFVRSMKDDGDGTFTGLDYYDVYLDKDALLAPDGTIFWADLEGLEMFNFRKKDLEEKMEYQIHRSRYEFLYAYEQIEIERTKRFGHSVDRKVHFQYLLEEALEDDKVIELVRHGSSLNLRIGNILGEESATKEFTILDFG